MELFLKSKEYKQAHKEDQQAFNKFLDESAGEYQFRFDAYLDGQSKFWSCQAPANWVDYQDNQREEDEI